MSRIISRPATDEYRRGWERVFGKDAKIHRQYISDPGEIHSDEFMKRFVLGEWVNLEKDTDVRSI